MESVANWRLIEFAWPPFLGRALRVGIEVLYVAVCVLLVAIPLMLLCFAPFAEQSSGAADSGAWLVLLRTGTRTIALRNLVLALTTTILCLVIAALVVFFLRRLSARSLLWISPLLLAPLLVDPLARNYGWYFLLRTNGVVNNALQWLGFTDHPIQLLYRFESLVVVMVQGLFPLAAIPLFLSALNLDRRTSTVAGALGASSSFTFRHVTLPLLAPGLFLGICFVLSNSFGYYITPKMLGGDAGLTIAGLIDQRVNLLLDWGGATALAMLLVVVALPCLFVFLRAFQRLQPLSGFSAVPNAIRQKPATASQIASWAILLIAVATPWVPLVLAAVTAERHLSFPPLGFSLRWFHKAMFDPDWSRCWRASILTASVSALLATLAAAGAVSLASRWRKSAACHLAIAAVPMLVPPIAMAVGVYRVLMAVGLSDEWVRMVLGHTVRVLPYPVLSLLLAWKGLNPAVVQATRVYGGRNVWAWVRALGPHYFPALVVGYLLAWITSFNDLEYSLFLAGPHSTTLPIQLWSSLHYIVEPTVPACAVLTTIIGLAAIFVVVRFVPSIAFSGDGSR